jgi:tetratricopeptide (TPR) repeat protein
MGEVYAGFDATLHRRVALKAIRAEQRLSALAKSRFLREARILSQLDHPGVCRVYDFIEADDSDWLVLELIEGKTLQAALSAGIAPASRMSIAEQLADVLVSTHRAGVVHRDLKPTNVMLTRGDRVKVLDFGLAQSGEPEAGEGTGARLDLPSPPDHADVTETRTSASIFEHEATQRGVITGTPAYMSPEQARGEPATLASDLYSFGLILQGLFGGGSPYPPGLDIGTLLDHVQRGATVPPAGVAADVASLITRLKSPSAADRPTAVEAAGRLRWIRDKPRRRLRHLAAAVLVLAAAGGATKYAVDLTRERTTAVAARDEADRRRGQAEDLIGFMLGDLRKNLEPVGRLDVLDGVGAKAMDYFAAVPADALSDEELLRRSTALYQIGEVRIAQGNLPAAALPLQESLSLAEALVARAPRNGDRLYGLAQSHYWVGYVHWSRHELDAAQRQFQAYLDVARRLVDIDPARTDWQREIGYANSNLGSVLQARGQLEAALERFRECLKIERGLLARAPEDDELNRAVASSHNAIGVVLLLRGRLDVALVEFGAERAILEQQVSRAPHNTGFHHRLMVTHSYLGDLFAARGQMATARRHYAETMRRATELASRDPANRSWQRHLARNLFKVGVLDSQSEPSRALPALARSVSILQVLVDADPTNAMWRRDFAESRYARGMASAGQGDLRAAAADGDAALRVTGELLRANPDDRESARIRSLAYALHARVHEARGGAARAREAWERSLAGIAPIALVSDDFRFLEPWAFALIETGRAGEAAGAIRKLETMRFHSPRLFAAAARNGLRLHARPVAREGDRKIENVP